MTVCDMFWEASFEDIKRGYMEKDDFYICLLCGERIEKGIVYLYEDIFYEAEKYTRIHIQKEHGSVFEHLINQDKKMTGLSEHQTNLLKMFYEDKSDAEIQSKLKIGSSSTIRNHRFVLREKEKQAKVFLALMELMNGSGKKSGDQVVKQSIARREKSHGPEKKVDVAYDKDVKEKEKILNKYFLQGTNEPLKTLEMKEKSRLVVLSEVVKRFEEDKIYSEKEIDEVLEGVHEDYVLLRRNLIEYGFMDRKADCSQYWVINKGLMKKNGMEENEVDRKKELIQQYKETKTEGGIYAIKNTVNQKIFVASTPNLKTINGATMQLNGGTHKNKELVAEWLEYGEAAFTFEVLQVLEEKEDAFFDKKGELKKLEEKWLEKLKPYGERGYNIEKK